MRDETKDFSLPNGALINARFDDDGFSGVVSDGVKNPDFESGDSNDGERTRGV